MTYDSSNAGLIVASGVTSPGGAGGGGTIFTVPTGGVVPVNAGPTPILPPTQPGLAPGAPASVNTPRPGSH